MSPVYKKLIFSGVSNNVPAQSSILKNSLWILAIGVIYFFVVQIIVLFFSIPEINMSVFWPPNAIYVASLLISPKYLWKYIFVTIFIANGLGNFNAGSNALLSSGFAIANVVEGGLIAYLSFKWNKPSVAFTRFTNFFLFIIIVIFSSFIGGLLGAVNLSLAFGWHQFFDYFIAWFPADSLGNLLLLTVIFTWHDYLFFFKKIKVKQVLAGAGMFISTIVVANLIYSQNIVSEIVPLNYLVFPLLIWAALQFQLKGVSIVLFTIAFVAHWYTIQGQGPFIAYGIDIREHIFWLQCYFATVFLTAISLALAVFERNNMVENLKINKMLIDEMPKGVVVSELENPDDKYSFRIVAINNVAANVYHSTVDQMLGKLLIDICDDYFDDELLDTYYKWVQQSKGSMKYPELTIEGNNDIETRVFKCESMLVGSDSVGTFYEDITQAKQEEEQHRQTVKLESLGTLAGGVAHDFNNVLGLILGYAEMGSMVSSPGRKEALYFDKISFAGKRATALVKKILTFSRMEPAALKPVDLAKSITEALAMIRPTIAANITIEQNILVRDSFVLADETDIHQIILNLCVNSSHAVAEIGGRIQITLTKHSKQSSSDTLKNSHYLPGKNYLRLDVADNGHGIESKIKRKIFDPFFTTKDVGKGTGLGLSMIYGTIKKYQGEISLESEVGKGTTFSLYFPMIEHQPAENTITEIDSDKYASGGHLLIVDDEPLLIELYQGFLKRNGYTITTCKNGLEALNLYKQAPNKYSLVFTDQEMPNMTGMQLSKALLAINKNLPIILATGYSENNSEKEALTLGIRNYFIKPIDLKVLNQTISGLLSLENRYSDIESKNAN